MGTYSKLQTSADLEKDGVSIDYGTDVGKFHIRRAGGANRKWELRREALMKPYVRQIQAGIMDDEVHRGLLIQAFVETVLVGWEGVTGPDGQPLDCTHENATQLFKDIPTIFDGLFTSATQHQLFLKDAGTAAEGN